MREESIKKQRNETTARDSDATSKDTLGDLEHDTEMSSDENGGTDNSPGPSPDGAFDEPDELDDAGQV